MVDNEEKYLIFNRFYCRACMNTIENDYEYQKLLHRQYQIDKILLENLRQIET